MPETPRFITVARLLKPRGNKGELAAQLLTDFPERLTKLKEVFLSDAKSKAEPRAVAVKNCWLSQNHKGQAVFHFENSNSINDAEKLRGLDVLLPIEQRVILPAGRYFVSDLVGCAVFERPANADCRRIITVRAHRSARLTRHRKRRGIPRREFPRHPAPSSTSQPPLPSGETEMLIPLAQDICTSINTTARRIEVLLPEGLRDLNVSE